MLYLDREKIKNMEPEKQAALADIYNDLALLASEKLGYFDAVSYLKKSLEIYKGLNDPEGIAGALLNMGAFAYELGAMELAFKFTALAVTLFPNEETEGAKMARSNLENLSKIVLKYDDEKIKAEIEKVAQEYEKRGFEFIDDLIFRLEAKASVYDTLAKDKEKSEPPEGG